MGGDRDGNPNVTATVTSHVTALARWMAADLYLREIDTLRFEVSIKGWGGVGWVGLRAASGIKWPHLLW